MISENIASPIGSGRATENRKTAGGSRTGKNISIHVYGMNHTFTDIDGNKVKEERKNNFCGKF